MPHLTRRQWLGSAAMTAMAAPEKPNVLVFMSDQESLLLPGPVNLPNRKRLENGGVRFTHAFCNTPQCSAARASLLTGLEPNRAGVLTNVDSSSLGKPLAPSLPTLGSVLANNGYSTGYFGKWHLSDENASLRAFGFQSRGSASQDAEVAVEAADWIREQKGPWLAWVSVLNPHNIYSLSDVPIRANVRPPASGLANLKGKPSEQTEYVEKDQGKQTRHYEVKDWLRYRSFYLNLVEKVDANLGTVLDAIPALDSTVAVYTSDHGDALGEHGLPFKGPFMYEEGIRIPLTIRAPWIPNRPINDSLVTQADLAHRLASLAGIAWPGPPPSPRREAVFLEYYAKQKWVNPIRTIRTREWKLNWYDRGNRELYRIDRDPRELHNLAGTAEYRAIQHSLERRLDEWRAPVLAV